MNNLPPPYTIISLEAMRVYAYHGVGIQERTIGNDFEVSVDIAIPSPKSKRPVNISDTISYAYVAEVARQEMAIPADLLEEVGLRIKDRLTDAFPAILSGRVKISKLKPPIPATDLKTASVAIVW
ncbi:MAG: dihydroneopterin aldolase [Pseudoflavonifractor sp.]|nr:dihydroneopterin aldolase [Pseudoflavonifractor sp.]